MIEETKQGVRLYLFIQPNGRKSEVLGTHNDRLKIRIQAPPTEGKANQEVIEFLAQLLGIPKKQIQLIRGETSRNKVVEVMGISLTEAKDAIGGVNS